MSVTVHQLTGAGQDRALTEGLLTMFGEAFGDIATFSNARPNAPYMSYLLGSDRIIALAAVYDQVVVGGLVAYELNKYEPERKELYIYDLAVAQEHRRFGIATALIESLKQFGKRRGAYLIFVQADRADAAAIGLYSMFGKPRDVLQFDIPID